MISLYLIAILSVFPVDREANKPISVEVSGTIEAVKADLIRTHLAAGYTLCGDTPSRLAFCTAEKVKRGFADRRERSFTSVEVGDRTIQVTATETILRVNMLGGKREMPQTDKQTRSELQKVLDQLKLVVEAILLPAQPAFKAFFIMRHK